MNPIITSLLETDMYKFSMGQAIYHQFPNYMTRWAFKCRNEDVIFTDEMIAEINRQLDAYCNLRFTSDELQYLSNIPWIKQDYVNFLKLWYPQRSEIKVERTDSGCHLDIQAYGTWLNTSMYEIAILAIVNEVYFKFQYHYPDLLDQFKQRASEKLLLLHDGEYEIGPFSEFGLRRRLSGEAQEHIISKLQDCKMAGMLNKSTFIGTSNVFLARKYDILPVGTMAHEFIEGVGQGNHMLNPAYSNHFMLESWVREYGVDNGIALTDCIGTDVFLRDFNKTYATLFSGVRHDSGDPIEWGNKIIDHYRKLGIDYTKKTLLFSDSLNFKRATEIYKYFQNKEAGIKVAFGIGTYLANDTDARPLNIVFKMIECNGMPVAKLSDTPGKCMCRDIEYINYLDRTIKWRLSHEN